MPIPEDDFWCHLKKDLNHCSQRIQGFCEQPCAFKRLLLLVPKSWGSPPLTSWVLATEYLWKSEACRNYWIKESYWGFLRLRSPVPVYTHLPGLVAFNRNNWSRTSLNNRILVLVFNCMYSLYLGMFKLGSLLLGNLIGVQRYCPRNCQGSMPI